MERKYFNYRENSWSRNRTLQLGAGKMSAVAVHLSFTLLHPHSTKPNYPVSFSFSIPKSSFPFLYLSFFSLYRFSGLVLLQPKSLWALCFPLILQFQEMDKVCGSLSLFFIWVFCFIGVCILEFDWQALLIPSLGQCLNWQLTLSCLNLRGSFLAPGIISFNQPVLFGLWKGKRREKNWVN